MSRKNVTFTLTIALFTTLVMISYVSTAVALPSRSVTTVIPQDPLVIDDAYYCNLDDDGMEDDCVTLFTLYSPTGLLADIKVDLDLSILLPSGQYFYFSYRIAETFVSLPIEIEWYNVAVESGWYNFTVAAHIWGVDIEGVRFTGNISETLTFDPRDYRSGALPFAIVIF